MFSKENRYMTIGVEANATAPLVMVLFEEIDKIVSSKLKVDYLQVFRITILDYKTGLVEIEHTQEVPKYKNIMFINGIHIKEDLTIFVIDEDNYSTMMLAEEY